MGIVVRVIASILLLPLGVGSPASVTGTGEVAWPGADRHPAHELQSLPAVQGEVGGPREISDAARDATSLRPQVTVLGATAAQDQQVTDTLALFAAANLPLPHLVIEFADSSDACRGHAGLFRPAAEGPDQVTICGRLALFLRHELAHAWARHALADADRTRMLRHWGLARWNDSRDDWGDRGGEMAAQTIAFGLGLTEPTDDPNLLRFVCSYEALTGEPAPEAVRDGCQPHISSSRA